MNGFFPLKRAATVWLVALALVLAGCNDSLVESTEESPAPRAPVASTQPDSSKIPGQYIVVLKDEVQGAATQAQRVADRRNIAVQATFEHALKGFVAEMSAQDAQALADEPDVAFVEQDQYMYVTASQRNAPWGLDRIDARSGLDDEYTYRANGRGVTAYILDTGIRLNHRNFQGRATAGFDAFGGNGGDQNGHGTHVAGTVGSQRWGVAKNVDLVSVKVCDANGRCPTSDMIAGVNYVARNARGPSVANMSISGGPSRALDNAIRNAISEGVTFAVAAGNETDDACRHSPARLDGALTVGATNRQDGRASFSNYGSCVDLFAPGVRIKSTWPSSRTATAILSGTSMASPHVAGVAALYLQKNRGAAPAKVFRVVRRGATRGQVTSRRGSPNRLLYSLIGGGNGRIIIDSNDNNNGANADHVPPADWNVGSYGSYYGTGYYWHAAEASSDAVTFRFYLESAERKTVYAWWTQGSNRTSAAPHIAYNSNGQKLGTIYEDQRANGGQWNGVGTWNFTAGWNEVKVSHWTGAQGMVVADAIMVE
jgi:subtilisin family serine protease